MESILNPITLVQLDITRAACIRLFLKRLFVFLVVPIIFAKALADDRNVISWRDWLTSFLGADSEGVRMPQ